MPLSQQDAGRWSLPMLHEAHHLLLAAQKAGRIGHFQLEAAIQSIHTRRTLFGGDTDWGEVALLYKGLVRIAPTTGALVARANATAHAQGTALGWKLLQAIPAEAVRTYLPYWALAADLVRHLGRNTDACTVLERAVGLPENAAARNFLTNRPNELRERAKRSTDGSDPRAMPPPKVLQAGLQVLDDFLHQIAGSGRFSKSARLASGLRRLSIIITYNDSMQRELRIVSGI